MQVHAYTNITRTKLHVPSLHRTTLFYAILTFETQNRCGETHSHTFTP